MWTLIAPGFLLACYFCWANTTDDSFISFRYARNLAAGLGLVFNPGERIEGFSNPLWVLLLAGFEVMHLDLLTASKITGVLCALVTLRTTMKIAIKKLGLGAWYGSLAAFFLATEMGFIYYSVSGMETICFVMQITLLADFLLEQRFLPASIISGTLLLTRPEGPLFALPLFATLVMRKRRFSAVLPFLMIPVTLFLIEVGWRYRYYGQVLPNTFQAKIGAHGELFRFLSTHTFNFAAYSALFSLRYLFLGLLLVPCLIAFGALPRMGALPLAASMIPIVLFVWYSGGDWMEFFRFYVHGLPLIALTSYLGLLLLERRLEARARIVPIARACALLPIGFNLVVTAVSIHGLNTNTMFNPAMNSRSHIEIARYLAKVARPSDTVAVNEIGAIGYYTDLRTLDLIGLTNRVIADLIAEHSPSRYAAHVMSQEPRFVLLNSWEPPPTVRRDPLSEALFQAISHDSAYGIGPTFRLNAHKDFVLFVRADRSE